jgi:hypothetical protein
MGHNMTLQKLDELAALVALDQALSDAVNAATHDTGDIVRNDGRCFQREIRTLIKECFARAVAGL